MKPSTEKRGKADHRLQLSRRRRLETTFRERDSVNHASEAGSKSRSPCFPPLPASKLAAVNGGDSKEEEKRSLLDIWKEREEVRKQSMKWSPLPPPNLELYAKKPVVLLDWEETDDGTTVEEFPDNDSQTRAEDYVGVIDVDMISDDDNFSDFSQLTATLETAEREQFCAETTSLQNKDIINKQESKKDDDRSFSMVREEENVPPPPPLEFDQDVVDDDDEYGNGSDMDLFANEDLDRLYDNVDQQLLKDESFSLRSDANSLLGEDSLSNDDVILIDDSSPIVTELRPRLQETSQSDSFSKGSSDAKVQPQTVGLPGRSSTPHCWPGSSTSNLEASFSERGKESAKAICEEKSTHGRFTSRHVVQPRLPPSAASALRARSLSSDSKQSFDSDDLPPVNWGFTTTAAATKVKDEPTAHCSKDLLQPSSSHPPSLQCNLVAEKCPICDMSFPPSYTQLEVDEHVALCLNAMDWDEDL